VFDSKVTLPQRRKIGKWQSLNVEKAAKAAFEYFKLLQKNAVLIPSTVGRNTGAACCAPYKPES